jgi:UDP-N-acetylglucosamine 2-epimerase (non-hydrolysing)
MTALEEIGWEMPVIFPVHPRTSVMIGKLSSPAGRKRYESGNQMAPSGLRLIDPLGYLDFLKLMAHASIVLTDSGGIQEETTVLKVPCLTLRENTERPITVDMGTNRVVGSDPGRILEAYRDIMNNGIPSHRTPPLWDGRAAERIANIILGEKVL